MKINRTTRWLAGAALAAVGIAASAHEASADHRLMAVVDASQSCLEDPANNIVFGEAWGFDFLGNKACEAMSTGGTAAARCPGNAISHKMRIDTRTVPSYSLSGTVYTESALQTSWTSASPQVAYVEPANPNCPSGQTVYAISQGIETPGNAVP